MTTYTPDATDWLLLDALQRNGRAGYAELARAVSMSASAVTERVRRMEEAGIIQGYAAVVDPERLVRHGEEGSSLVLRLYAPALSISSHLSPSPSSQSR